MNLSFSLLTLAVAVSVFLAEEGESYYIGKHAMTDLTDRRDADTGPTKRFFEKLLSVRQRRSELKTSPYKSVERGYDDVMHITERRKSKYNKYFS
ncbi:hypothetical protein HOLleu_09395 [Holothuria leucospilota]|uniref:Uncharacterized protein n=1 Tax=Holothuria leucospilota TaxID=206669 RepID=A0A9Q1CBF7_HOLLE|nr:hypothetical protein HOLleu_09395 [Holothuria leucospilota]